MRAVAPLLIHPALILVTLALSTALAVSVVPVAAAPATGAASGVSASGQASGGSPAATADQTARVSAGRSVLEIAGPVDARESRGPASALKTIVDQDGLPEAPGTGAPTASPSLVLATQAGDRASTGAVSAAATAAATTRATSATVPTAAIAAIATVATGSSDTIAGVAIADRNEQLVVAVPSGTAGTGTTPTGYPVHTGIVSTTFWVGEIFNANLSDGSQVCSTYDGQWALHHTGVTIGITPAAASGCAGSVYGGCDGVSSGTGSAFHCATETRTAVNGFLPTSQPAPLQNAFYLDLPFDDVNDPTAFAGRCTVVPWARDLGLSHCADAGFSYLKNRWVRITGPNGHVCYGQVEDAGPSSGALYHDAGYVFGATNARPVNLKFSGDSSQGAGMDVSPALNGCLGFSELDGDTDHVDWSFTERADVPAGPWLRTVTTSQVTD